MKNLPYFLMLLWMGFLSTPSMAQNLKRVVVKADGVETAKKHFSTAVEWRFSPKNSVELQLGFQRHNSLPSDVFNGDWTTNYGERRNYIISLTSSPPADNLNWHYLGTGRPLPEVSGPILSLSTLYTRAAYGMSYQRNPRGLRILLLPGIALLRHQYYEIDDKIVQNETIYEHWQINASQNHQEFVEETAYYTQTRQMRLKNKWIGGATYAVGIAWQSKSGLYLEARMLGGVNIGDVPYSKQKPSAVLKNYYGQGAFYFGWAF